MPYACMVDLVIAMQTQLPLLFQLACIIVSEALDNSVIEEKYFCMVSCCQAAFLFQYAKVSVG